MNLQADASTVEACDHCGLAAFYPIHGADKIFCCHGCLQVNQILETNGLNKYYDLKNEGVRFSDAIPVKIVPKEEFLYLDQPEFFETYGQRTMGGDYKFSFYIEGVTCLACLWLLEKIPQIRKEIQVANFNLSLSKLDVTFKDINLSEIASLISHLGYKVYPLKNEQDRKNKESNENRKEVIRLAVSGMFAGNIMLFAIALYGGALGEWGTYFKWGTALLSVPVLTYGSLPFYRNFFRDIRLRKISIDTPIVLSLLIGSGIGLYNLFRGNEDLYFDTLTILVFLLLASRLLLRTVKQKGLQLNHLTDYFIQSWTRRWSEQKQEYEKVHVDQLQVGQKIEIHSGELVPIDGILLKGDSLLNTSLITGEFAPQKSNQFQKIISGTEVLEGPLEIEIKKVGIETELGKILEQVKGQWVYKNKTTRLTDKLARYLVSFVLLIAFIMFSILITKDFDMALSRTLALIIITCPCALGLATPLAMVLGMRKAAERGVIIKSDEALEKSAKTKNLFLDKTGTLTHGRFQVVNWSGENIEIRSIVYELEKISKHPIAQSLIQYIEGKNRKEIFLEKRIEEIGTGVAALKDGENWSIQSIPSNENLKNDVYQTQVGVFRNGECLSVIKLEDSLRQNIIELLEELRKLNVSPNVLSGDNEKSVKHIGKQISLNENFLYYNASPDAKKQIIKSQLNTMMVGDGANDALAFSEADVGVAVQGSVNMSLKVADVYLTNPGIQGVIDLIKISKETMYVVKRNIFFSILYNAIGVTAACLGWVTPLWAAVFMPISSVTVVLSTLVGTKELRRKIKLRRGM